MRSIIFALFVSLSTASFAGCAGLKKRKAERSPQGLTGLFKQVAKKVALRESVAGKDLSGQDLRNIDFGRINLDGTLIGRKNLDGTILKGADLRGAYLTNVSNWRKAEWEGASVDFNTGLPRDMSPEDFRNSGLVLNADLRRTDIIMDKMEWINRKRQHAEEAQAKMNRERLEFFLRAGAPVDFKGASLKAKLDLRGKRHISFVHWEQRIVDDKVTTLDTGRLSRGILERQLKDSGVVFVFSGLDLRSAKNLEEADLRGAVYDDLTKFPEGFDPKEHGLLKFNEEKRAFE